MKYRSKSLNYLKHKTMEWEFHRKSINKYIEKQATMQQKVRGKWLFYIPIAR